MNRILKEIIERKRNEAPAIPLGNKGRLRKVMDAVASLREKPFIAEIKKASPSAGEIRSGGDIMLQAGYYARGGAGAISVLTEETFFKGSIEDLEAVAAFAGLPVLCKDFIVHERQIERAHEAGADMVLLIARVLSETELRRLSASAVRLGLTVLHEIHNMNDFDKIRGMDLAMVGVNARDLSNFTVDMLAATLTMRKLDGSFMKVAESGLKSAGDVKAMHRAGADAFLVGTVLMKSGDPAGELQKLYRGLD